MEIIFGVIILFLIIFYFPFFFKKKYDSYGGSKDTPLTLGEIIFMDDVMTAMNSNEPFGDFVVDCLTRRYSNKDWGDILPQDKAYNNESCEVARQVLGIYVLPLTLDRTGVNYANGESAGSIWISTNPNRSITRISFPDVKA